MPSMKMISSNKLRDDFLEKNVDIKIYKGISPIYQCLIEAYFYNELRFIYVCNNIVFYGAFQKYLTKKFNLKDHNIRQLVRDLEYYNLISTTILYNKKVLRLNTNIINYFNKTLNIKSASTNRITNNGLYKSCYKSYVLNNYKAGKYGDYIVSRKENYILFYLFDFESNPLDFRYLKELIEKDFIEYNFDFKITVLTYSNDRKEILDKTIKNDIYFRNNNFLGFENIINTDLKKEYFTYSAQR